MTNETRSIVASGYTACEGYPKDVPKLENLEDNIALIIKYHFQAINTNVNSRRESKTPAEQEYRWNKNKNRQDGQL